MKLAKKILMACAALLLSFLFLEGMLLSLNFSFKPRENGLLFPWVAMKFRTVIGHYPTRLDPPGYIWIMPPDTLSRPQMSEFAWPDRKTPGKKLIAFLGGSTTQPDWMKAYPRRCVNLLNLAAGTNEYELLNCGMSSYTTHQSLIALRRYVLPRDPDAVVVFHGWNDPGVSQWGYGDSEVERSMKMNQKLGDAGRILMPLKKTRLASFVAMLVEKSDRTWPRQRVSWQEFERNLDQMAALCAQKDIPLIVVSRPASRFGQREEISELMTAHYRQQYGTNRNDIYFGIHSVCTAIQARVTQKHLNARLAPASEYLDLKQRELEANPVRGVAIFLKDDLHLEGLGYQYLAECVSKAVAPELAERIDALIGTADYWKILAREFWMMDSPFECRYAVQRARKLLKPSNESELDELEQWAESQFTFHETFERCRWDCGMVVPLDERLAGLAQCLKLRPSDYGVAQQIHRVCLYLDTTARALPYLVKFQPANDDDRYNWLKLCLDAAEKGAHYQAAIQASQAILQMNPNDADALQFMSRLKPR